MMKSGEKTCFVIPPTFRNMTTWNNENEPSVVPTPLPSRLVREEAPVSLPEQPNGPTFRLPKLRLQLADLSHPAAGIFLANPKLAPDMLHDACNNVLKKLYESSNSKKFTPPPTRSVTLILRSMGGVAYTAGLELDDDHKEIHFSLEYINKVPTTRVYAEIEGVVTHELVHCLQYSNGSPIGLTEGIADWVRLQCGLSPPHWKKGSGGKWDAGYEKTAYFLDYLEDRFGKGTVRKINEKLRLTRYEHCTFWTELLGWPVERLWKDYGAKLDE